MRSYLHLTSNDQHAKEIQMTTLELQDFADERPTMEGVFNGFLRLIAAPKRWYVRRQTLACLSRLSDRQLRDMGFDPSEVYDVLNWGHSSLGEKPHSRPDIR
jgi:uncharacterized protein YjiS (DUF1127 family)